MLVEPGDEVELTARVEGSAFPEEVEFEAEAGTITSVQFDGDKSHRLTYQSPADGDIYPILITGRSTSSTGARRHPDAPERIGTATISTDVSVTVDPAGTCVEMGDTKAFSAIVTGSPDQSVTWETSAGAIDGGGTFTAPSQPGAVTITARSVSDPDVEGAASVWVDEDCTCWWTINISGGYNATMAGDTASSFREILDDGSIGGWAYAMFGNEISTHYAGVLPNGTPVPVGQTGTYGADIWGTIFPSSDLNVDWGAQEDSEIGIHDIDILENGERFVRADAYGVMRGRINLEGEDSQQITVSVKTSFRADLPPFYLQIMGEDPESYCKAP